MPVGLRMTQVIRKSGPARLIITAVLMSVLLTFLFDFAAQNSFIANYYVPLRFALLHGTFGIDLVPNLILVLISCFVFFLIPSYFCFLLFYAFGKRQTITSDASHFVSIIVPAKDREKDIRRTLECLLASDYPKDKMEILVVTSGSTDRTEENCREFAAKGSVKVLNKPLQKKGKPAALNYALANAKGELVAIFDADTVTAPTTLQNLSVPFNDPSVSAVAGPIQVLNQDENSLTKGTALENTYYSGAGLLYEIRERLGQSIFLLGRNFCVRKNVLTSFGGFEESSLTEDFSLMFKLREQGKRMVFSPRAVAKDLCPPHWAAFSLQRKRWSAGWNEENKKYMTSTKDKRRAGLGMINFLLYVNLPLFTFFALIFAPLFGLMGEYVISVASLVTIISTLSLMAVAVYKYGNKKFGLLAYLPVYIYTSFFMFANAAVKPEKTDGWTETPH